MKKKLGIFLVRGAGKADSTNDRQKFVEKVNKYLAKRNIDTDEIYYEYANWYGPTQDNEDLLLKRFFSSNYKIGSKGLRRFILNLVSDIVAYVGEPNRVSTAYQRTHELIYESIKNIEKEVEPGSPLIIIASSLGTEIISNYIWDRQKNEGSDPFGNSPFQRLHTLTAVLMFGNNNVLYLPAYNIDSLKPFQFPPTNLPDKFKSIAYWGNYYDKNDALGFPLKPINSYFDSMVSEDVQINVGGLIFSWNAGSHLGYWKTRKLRIIVADYIEKVMKSI
jgi:hypothetical protein